MSNTTTQRIGSALRRTAVAGTLAAAAAGFLGASATANAATVDQSATSSSGYTFSTLNDHTDPTFNQLLGINDHRVIAGYFTPAGRDGRHWPHGASTTPAPAKRAPGAGAACLHRTRRRQRTSARPFRPRPGTAPTAICTKCAMLMSDWGSLCVAEVQVRWGVGPGWV